jgi:hypothetical protein
MNSGMSRHLKASLTLDALLLFGVVAPTSMPTVPLGSHGSLLVTIPSHDGLLICTDKREYNEVQVQSMERQRSSPLVRKRYLPARALQGS